MRVAAYCRVSTDRDDQANSLQSQRSYFREHIQRHAGWTLIGVYADEGVSGTSIRRREAFNRMMAEAEAGGIDLILTKEVSRFARNTLDTLEYTRRLKRLGVGVLFINDNIDTRDGDGELRLTIMASIAQEESRKTSERVKWGQKRRMEAGVVFGNDSTYGFETRQGCLHVRPEEAETVRLIYHKFLNEGKGTHVIARELFEEGCAPPKTAAGKWSAAMILRVLRNEKYAGDLLQKKYVTPDYLTHKKVLNTGQEEQLLLRDHHEAIVEREVWQAAQRELERRAGQREDSSRYSNRRWCSGMIRCGFCGSRFVSKAYKRSGGGVYRIWGCHERVRCGNWKTDGQGGTAGCGMRMVNDKSLSACAAFVVERLELDGRRIAGELLEEIQPLQNAAETVGISQRLKDRRRELERRRECALDAFLDGQITGAELAEARARYGRELDALEARRLEQEAEARAAEARRAGLEENVWTACMELSGSEEVWREVIEAVTVFDSYIDVKARCMPNAFRLWYDVSGRGAGYRTQVRRWELV